ncbi:hypothetical protein GCK72_014769 [Caenorhabditis remanei]|uniref:Uncharacterized protein n=1 Tax=Caenorhabditis remanei TaxID=31234 RepID=A0A6A5GUP6_CAERE|nr:hypothetical protein GCK72_014769 [Caenorhabditis remanei]KAF1758311.1 hypothetical protein GCK72_014769 [Caenorhabditis remanei]
MTVTQKNLHRFSEEENQSEAVDSDRKLPREGSYWNGAEEATKAVQSEVEVGVPQINPNNNRNGGNTTQLKE